MKNLIVSVIFILFITNVNAQDTGTGMPKELKCTEKAFNVSFSVGQKLNFSKPKMGPVEAATYQTDYIPAWALKPKAVLPERYLPASFQPKSFTDIDKERYLFSAVNFNAVAGYPAFNYAKLKLVSVFRLIRQN
jgi:hypothetical protein